MDAKGRDYSGARVLASVGESKERLGLGMLPIVFLHDPEYHDFTEMTKSGGAVDTLNTMRDEGEIGHVGLAGGPVQEMSRYLDLGGFEVLLVHNRSTLIDRSATDLIARLRGAGIAIVNAAIYGGGLLADPRGGSRTYAYQPAPRATLNVVAEMDRVCTKHGTDLATAALQASVSDSRIKHHRDRAKQPEAVGLPTGVPARRPARHTVRGAGQPNACPRTLAGLPPGLNNKPLGRKAQADLKKRPSC